MEEKTQPDIPNMVVMVQLRDVFTRQARLFRADQFDATEVPAAKLFDRCQSDSVHTQMSFERFVNGDTLSLREDQLSEACDHMRSPIRKLFNSDFLTDADRAAITPLMDFGTNDMETAKTLLRAYNHLKARIEATEGTVSYIAEDKNGDVGWRNTYVDETPAEIADLVEASQARIIAQAMKLAK